MISPGNSRRALVTGAAGFVGQWLSRELLVNGWKVTGTGIGELPVHGTLTSDERAAIEWLPADIRQQAEVARVVATSRPDAIFHLAGISFVPDAQGDPMLTHDINVLGAARLLHEVRTLRRSGDIDPVVVIVGSAEQYGVGEVGRRRLEGDVQAPVTVYAASKAAQEVIALEAARSEGVRVIATRSFNHSGTGQAEHFLLPALVKRAQAVKAGSVERLRIGNADTVRDFLHVRDVVRAYLLLVENGLPGEAYNVCSGTGQRVRNLAERVLMALGAHAEIAVDQTLVRRVEVPWLVGDATKLCEATGWTPSLTCDDIIADLINAPAR